MGLPKGYFFGHQVVGQVRGQEVASFRGVTHPLDIYFEAGHHARKGLQGGEKGVYRIEEALLVLLQVTVVGHGQALEYGEQGHEVAVDPARLAPGQLGEVRVALLGHDAAAGGEVVAEADKAKLLGGPEDELFGQSGEVHHADGGRRLVVQQEVPVGYSVHAVAGDTAETQLTGDVLPVDGVGHPCQGSASQGEDVGTVVCLLKALLVPLQHLEVGQHVVGK